MCSAVSVDLPQSVRRFVARGLRSQRACPTDGNQRWRSRRDRRQRVFRGQGIIKTVERWLFLHAINAYFDYYYDFRRAKTGSGVVFADRVSRHREPVRVRTTTRDGGEETVGGRDVKTENRVQGEDCHFPVISVRKLPIPNRPPPHTRSISYLTTLTATIVYNT